MKTDGLERADFFKVPEGIKFYVYGSGKDTITLVQQINRAMVYAQREWQEKNGMPPVKKPVTSRHCYSLIILRLLQGVRHNLRS
jgi:hypothetical protein